MLPRALTTSGRRAWRGAALAAVAALALSGCMKFDIDLSLQPDDTVDGSMTIGMAGALVEMSGQDPSEMAEQMREEILADQPAGGASVEEYDDGEFMGSTVHFTGAALADFGAQAAGEDGLTLERVGDEFVVSGVMDLDQEGMGAGQFVDPEIRLAITFPGKVIEHTGELDGRTVTWVGQVGEVTQVSARGAATEGVLSAVGGTLVWVAVAALLLALALVLVLARRRRRTAADAATTHAPAAAPAAPATAAPAETPSAPPSAEPSPQDPTSPEPPSAPPTQQ